MLNRNLKKPIITIFTVGSILLTLFAANLVSASSGSISMANTYPENEQTYVVVDHFIYQTSAVNANTTVSVSIDDGQPIPMVFQGVENEVVNGDAVARDWYTWQVTVPAIANSGNHTFQFLSHYYVRQDTDNYWAEFNAHSNPQSFIIEGPASTPSTSTLTSTPPVVPQVRPIPELQPWIILPLIAVAVALLSIELIKKKTSEE